MGGSTGNQSGGSSTAYPPSLYDTSVSSASGGRSSRQNAPNRGMYSKQQTRERLSRYHPSPRSNRSIEYAEYPQSRGMATMSDPGGMLQEQDQYRSESEYARSEMGLSAPSYYDAQHRFITESQHLQSSRQNQLSNPHSPSSPPRRRLPPQNHLPSQYRESSYRPEQNFTRESQIRNRDHSFGSNGSQEFRNEAYRTSPLHEERPNDVLLSSSTVNIKELKRQLWDDDEVLIPSSPQTFRRVEPLVSPVREAHRQYSNRNEYRGENLSQTKNFPRYARSLSPRRRQYQSTPPKLVDPPPSIRKAESNVSETSYNKFHSKFFEAAIVAQNRSDGTKTDNGTERISAQMNAKQHRSEPNTRRLSSPLPFDETESNKYPDQRNTHREKGISNASSIYGSTNRMNTPETYKRAAEFYKQTSNVAKMDSTTRRPPIVPPSPSSLPSPRMVRSERQERRVDRGRSMETTPNIRRIRTPSPLIQERIRSFDSESYQNTAPQPSPGRIYHSANFVQDYHPRVALTKSRERINRDFYDVSTRNVGSGGNNGKKTPAIDSFEATRSANFDIGHNEGKDRENLSRDEKRHKETSQSNFDQQQNPTNRQQHHNLDPKRLNDCGDDISDERMANLVDKLSAVNREDPKSALAQIDSILRQESRSFHTRTTGRVLDIGTKKYPSPEKEDNPIQSNPMENAETVDQDGDQSYFEDDDESSDVSSITNPTYLPSSARTNSNRKSPVYLSENDHYKVLDSSNDDNLGVRNIGASATSPFNPSTSSFRRPRPSHLQNYSKRGTLTPTDKTMIRSEWKQEQVEKYPPPSTIEVKDESGISSQDQPPDIRQQMLQKNMEISRSKKNLGNIIGEKHDIAKKINSWDELSNQLPRSKEGGNHPKDQSKKSGGNSFEQRKGTSRSHPWDRMDTTETKIAPVGDKGDIASELGSTGDPFVSNTNKPSPRRQGISDQSADANKKPLDEARRNIRHGKDTNPFNDDSFENSTYSQQVNPQFPDISFSSDGIDAARTNSNKMPNVTSSMEGIPQFYPREINHKRREEKKVERLFETKGANWVAVPPSSFFPEIDENLGPRTRTNGNMQRNTHSYETPASGRHQASIMTRRGDKTIKMSLGDNSRIYTKTAGGITEPKSMKLLACKTFVDKDPKAKEKKRGFLRSFMEKKTKKDTVRGYASSATNGSIGGHSNSVESRGVKSMSHLQNSGKSHSSNSPSRNIQILPPPPGVIDDNNPHTGVKGRGRLGDINSSASRNRGNSTERFRSSNMAKKFNRVMQLYDSDEM